MNAFIKHTLLISAAAFALVAAACGVPPAEGDIDAMAEPRISDVSELDDLSAAGLVSQFTSGQAQSCAATASSNPGVNASPYSNHTVLFSMNTPVPFPETLDNLANICEQQCGGDVLGTTTYFMGPSFFGQNAYLQIVFCG